MDMHAEDIEMDDYSEQNEAFLQSTATWTRPVRASSAPVNGLAVYMVSRAGVLTRSSTNTAPQFHYLAIPNTNRLIPF